MDYNSNDWMQFRSECIEYNDKMKENALKKFMEKIGFKDIFAYDYNYTENKFTIYTTKPGIWIGLHGRNIKILKEILSQEVKEDCNVDFQEIRGKFLVVN